MSEQKPSVGKVVPKPPEPRAEEEIMTAWTGEIGRPLVSVVCHSFNHVSVIKDALNSFLMQETNFPFEIVVHDDASEDGTQEVIRQYQSQYPNIVRPILQTNNIYSSGERPSMYSFPAAKGKYIAFCEGDDYWIDEGKLQKQVSFLEDNSDYALCYTDSMPFHNETVLCVDFGGARRDLSSAELKRAPAIYTLTSCFRNVLDVPPESALAKYGDKFIWSRLGAFGKGKYLDEVLPSLYRVHGGGVHSLADEYERKIMNVFTYSAMASYYQRVGDEELFEYFMLKLKRQVYGLDDVSRRLLPVMKFVTQLALRLKKILVRISKI